MPKAEQGEPLLDPPSAQDVADSFCDLVDETGNVAGAGFFFSEESSVMAFSDGWGEIGKENRVRLLTAMQHVINSKLKIARSETEIIH